MSVSIDKPEIVMFSVINLVALVLYLITINIPRFYRIGGKKGVGEQQKFEFGLMIGNGKFQDPSFIGRISQFCGLA